MRRFLPLTLALAMLLTACASADDVPPAPVPTPAIVAKLPADPAGIPLVDVFVLEDNAVVTMDVESYVAGVLAGEMRADWPLEALKAQAILARTFVLKFLSEKTSMYTGADISTDITEAQAYNAAAVDDNIRRAAAETAGQVLLTSAGELPYTWFHAHSGGATALAREGLGYRDAEPAYTLVTDGMDSPDAPEEAAKWEATFTKAELIAACQKIGEKITKVGSVSIAQKGESGRAVTLTIGGAQVNAAELRMVLGSTVFRSTLLTDIQVNDASVTFAGRGYGHGVGMPQWGAYALAQDGMAGQDIALHYFDGLHLTTLW